MRHQDLRCKHTERQAAAAVADLHWVYGDAWEWVWDQFWRVIMHSNGTLPLPLTLGAPLDARCGYSFNFSKFTEKPNEIEKNSDHGLANGCNAVLLAYFG